MTTTIECTGCGSKEPKAMHDVMGHVPKPKRKSKNECAKTRPVTNPYETWGNGTWTWKVLKKWQADDNKPYARWFCFVTSPFCPNGEMGDVYVSEIKSNAVRIPNEEA